MFLSFYYFDSFSRGSDICTFAFIFILVSIDYNFHSTFLLQEHLHRELIWDLEFNHNLEIARVEYGDLIHSN